MKPHFALVGLFPLLILVLFGQSSEVVAQQGFSASIETLEREWKSREERIRSFDVTWRGPYIDKTVGRNALLEKQKSDETPDSWSYEKRARYIVKSDQQIKMEYDEAGWDAAKAAVRVHNVILVSNDKVTKTYFEVDGTGRASFHIEPAEARNEIRLAFLTPIYLAFRPLEFCRRLDFPGAGWKLESLTANEAGLLVLRRADHSIWIDPEKGLLPVRYYKNWNGKTVTALKIDYKLNDEGIWLPKSFEDVGLYSSLSATVLSCDVNTELSDDLFDMEPPPNTYVHDYRTKESYIKRATDIRPVGRGEYDGKNFDVLIATDPPTGIKWHRWVMGVLAILVISVLAAWRLVRLRQAKDGR